MGRRGRVGGYFKRGVLRWHWFGDKVPGKWNPHANVVVDSGYIENEQLNTSLLRKNNFKVKYWKLILLKSHIKC